MAQPSSFDATPGRPWTARKGSSPSTLPRFFRSSPSIVNPDTVVSLAALKTLAVTDVESVSAAHAAFRTAGPDLPAVLAAHHAFHAALMARCPNRPMLTAIDRYAQQSVRFQMLATAGRAGPRDLDAEHADLLRAAVEGRAEDGSRVLTEHLRASLAELRARPV